jgi:hypothetical protein
LSPEREVEGCHLCSAKKTHVPSRSQCTMRFATLPPILASYSVYLFCCGPHFLSVRGFRSLFRPQQLHRKRLKTTHDATPHRQRYPATYFIIFRREYTILQWLNMHPAKVYVCRSVAEARSFAFGVSDDQMVPNPKEGRFLVGSVRRLTKIAELEICEQSNYLNTYLQKNDGAISVGREKNLCGPHANRVILLGGNI